MNHFNACDEVANVWVPGATLAIVRARAPFHSGTTTVASIPSGTVTVRLNAPSGVCSQCDMSFPAGVV